MSESESDPSILPLSPSSTILLALRQNTTDPEAKWLVQKYGGTSVGKFAVNIARDIVSWVFVMLYFSLTLISFTEPILTNTK